MSFPNTVIFFRNNNLHLEDCLVDINGDEELTNKQIELANITLKSK